MSMLTCVCVRGHVCASTLAHICALRDQRLTLGSFLHQSLLCTLRQSLFLEFIEPAGLVSQGVPEIHLSQHPLALGL